MPHKTTKKDRALADIRTDARETFRKSKGELWEALQLAIDQAYEEGWDAGWNAREETEDE